MIRAAGRFAALCGVVIAAAAEAQTPHAFKARLSPLPADVRTMETVAGGGSVTATLEGNRLTINGTFERLASPATVARLHRGYRGIKGTSFAELVVTGDTNGTISGSLVLTPAQVNDLQKGLVYVQLHSEGAPDGHLWGWLLPDKEKSP